MTHTQLAELIRLAAIIIGGGGVAVPFIVSLVNSAHWPKQAKQAAMIAVSIIVGVATYLASNNWTFNPNDTAALGLTVAGIVTAAQTAYHGLWKQGGITTAITAARTSALTRTPAAVTETDDSVTEHGQDASDNADQKSIDPEIV